MTYSDTVATIAMIVAVIAVPASGYLSYYYAIKGERRKEFNAAADSIRQKLFSQIRLIEQGCLPNSNTVLITESEFDFLMAVTKRSKVFGLDRAIKSYHKTFSDCLCKNEDYSLSMINPGEIIRSIEVLLTFVQRK